MGPVAGHGLRPKPGAPPGVGVLRLPIGGLIIRVDAMGLRPLTPGETSVLHPIFGGAINYAVNIRKGGAWSLFGVAASIAFVNHRPAIAMGDTIYVHPAHWSDDYSRYGDPGLLPHEMTHIWQYANRTIGGRLLGPIHVSADSLLRGGDRAYELPPDLSGSTAFDRLGFEQQAMVVQAFAVAFAEQNVSKAELYGRVMMSGGLLAGGWRAGGEKFARELRCKPV
jgi:hypothetical protein